MVRRRSSDSDDALTFVISVAAELAGMHPQTLRQYDRLGLVTPARTKGRGRRYSQRDVQRLREVQRMSQDEGINLAGIQRILELERRVESLEAERVALRQRVEELEARQDRVFAASANGVVSPMRRGERPWVNPSARDGRGREISILRPIRTASPYPERTIRAVIEAGPLGVWVIDGTISVVD